MSVIERSSKELFAKDPKGIHSLLQFLKGFEERTSNHADKLNPREPSAMYIRKLIRACERFDLVAVRQLLDKGLVDKLTPMGRARTGGEEKCILIELFGDRWREFQAENFAQSAHMSKANGDERA